jgi:hypothetical protein
MATVSFTDAGGVVEVSNLKAVPANRFTNWTPDALPIGPSKAGLGTGVIHAFTFREDYLVSFQIVGIPASELDKLLRLQTHLLDGYLVALDSDHEMNEVFALCSLAPNTEPSIEFSDATNLEYTFSCKLKAVDAEDADQVPEDEPFYPPGEEDCSDPVTLLSADRRRGESFADWPLGAVDPDLLGVTPNAERLAVTSEADDPFVELDVTTYLTYDVLPNLFITCSNYNGTSVHTLRGVKTAGDPVGTYGPWCGLNRINWPPSSSVVGFDDIWCRMRFRFSEDFYIPETPSEQEFIQIMNVQGVSTAHDVRLVIGWDESADMGSPPVPGTTYPLTGGLEIFHDIRTTTAQLPLDESAGFRQEIVAREDIFDGLGHELVMHSYDDTTGWRVRVWYGLAFMDDLTLVYDETADYAFTGGSFPAFDRADFFPVIVNALRTAPASGSQFHEITHPEYADGRVHADPYGVLP